MDKKRLTFSLLYIECNSSKLCKPQASVLWTPGNALLHYGVANELFPSISTFRLGKLKALIESLLESYIWSRSLKQRSEWIILREYSFF